MISRKTMKSALRKNSSQPKNSSLCSTSTTPRPTSDITPKTTKNSSSTPSIHAATSEMNSENRLRPLTIQKSILKALALKRSRILFTLLRTKLFNLKKKRPNFCSNSDSTIPKPVKGISWTKSMRRIRNLKQSKSSGIQNCPNS
jgi:hypothetical protein